MKLKTLNITAITTAVIIYSVPTLLAFLWPQVFEPLWVKYAFVAWLLSYVVIIWWLFHKRNEILRRNN